MPEMFVTLSKPVQALVDTSAAQDGALASEEAKQDCLRAAWNRIIDSFLIEWGRNPDSFDKEEIDPPSGRAIDVACTLAQRLRNAGEPAPLRVVPDGDGGIAFERSDGQLFQSLDVSDQGAIELVTFRDCRIVSRDPIEL